MPKAVPPMTAFEHHLQQALDAATNHVTFELASPSLWKSLEVLTTNLMHREQAAGRVRGFHVRCDATLNDPDSETIAIEVSYLPPAPRAKAVVVKLRGPTR